MEHSIAENRAKLCEALRSGKYTQGRARLHVGSSFCCLGVACDLVDAEKWVNSEAFDGARLYDGFGTYPPEWVSELYGFNLDVQTTDLPQRIRMYVERKFGAGEVSLVRVLASMNDCGEFDFEQIADFIEIAPVPEVAV